MVTAPPTISSPCGADRIALGGIQSRRLVRRFIDDVLRTSFMNHRLLYSLLLHATLPLAVGNANASDFVGTVVAIHDGDTLTVLVRA